MPKTLKNSAREIVLMVRAFCEKEKANKAPIIPLDQVRARVAAMTGVSEKTVSRITRQGKIALSTSQKICTPGKKRHKKKTVELSDTDLCVVQNKIQELYTIRKEVPTLNKLLVELRNDIGYKGGRTTLWKIIRQLGIKFKKPSSKKKTVTEYNITQSVTDSCKETDSYELITWPKNCTHVERTNNCATVPNC